MIQARHQLAQIQIAGTQPIMALGIALKEELPHKLVCEDGLELGNSICDQERMLQILSQWINVSSVYHSNFYPTFFQKH